MRALTVNLKIEPRNLRMELSLSNMFALFYQLFGFLVLHF